MIWLSLKIKWNENYFASFDYQIAASKIYNFLLIPKPSVVHYSSKMADINFPTYFQILFEKIKNFVEDLTEMEIAIIASISFFFFIIFLCFIILVVECVIKCRTRQPEKPLSAEAYFKRSVKISEKMSKINTPEFKHFELQLKRDSGAGSLSSSLESGVDSCFIDKCNHKERKVTEVDYLHGGVMV